MNTTATNRGPRMPDGNREETATDGEVPMSSAHSVPLKQPTHYGPRLLD